MISDVNDCSTAYLTLLLLMMMMMLITLWPFISVCFIYRPYRIR